MSSAPRASARRPRAAARGAASPVAKISAPRLAEVHARARLFKVLDRARERPVVWVSAPAGAGKTTLVASYLKARKLPFLWYRMDARDLDPAAFFYYLREAARMHSPRKRETLPLLTPEYVAGLGTFARNFFEALFGRLRARAALVFDNFQDLPENAALQQLLPEALSVVPDGTTIFFLSRSASPAAFARLHAQRAVRTLNAEDLRLSLEEARGIARLHKAAALKDDAIGKLHARVGGWTAGWILLLERLRDRKLSPADIPRDAREALFDYFATELFDRAAPETQELLLKTSLLPQVAVSSAEALTGKGGAAAALADLDRRNYFTTRLDSSEAVYQFHPLFREFLLARAKRELPADAIRDLQRKAAQILSGRDQHEDAAALLIESADWEGLTRIVLTQAPLLAQQGRLAAVEEWLRAFPEEGIEREPWLLYWRGVARLAAFDAVQGRPALERAYAGFKRTDDLPGLFLACAGVLSSYLLEFDQFTPTDPWMVELEKLVARSPNMVSPEIEAEVLSSMVSVSFRQPQHFVLRYKRTLELLRASTIPFQQASLASLLLQVDVWGGEFRRAEALLQEIESLLDVREEAPFLFMSLKSWEGILRMALAEHDAAYRASEDTLRVASESGVHLFDAMAHGNIAYAAANAGDLERAEAALARMEPLVIPSRGHDVSFLYHLRSIVALLRGDIAEARHFATEALARVEAAGASLNVLVTQVVLAYILVESGEHDAARAHLLSARRFAEQVPSPYFAFLSWLVEANSSLQTGERAAAVAALKRGLAIGRERDYMNAHPVWLPRVMSRLCALALEHGIETEYLTRLIRKRGLLAPSPEALEWPFPVKIYTLGRFSVLVDGEPLQSSGRGQRKPLELLMALVALGGRDVGESLLTEALWPDAGGGAGHEACAIALHRLRKLLGHEHAVTLQGNRFSLNPGCVWVDVWAFERGLAAPRAASDKALALYQGPFLGKDAEFAWALPLRERLRTKFTRHLSQWGASLLKAKEFELAITILEKGINVDPLAEEFYRNLMLCYQALSRRAEAIGVYQRCQKILAATLGVSPAPETIALYRTLQ
jgi:LuxR family transcriptional regulator, maltose regulon positive regulatory protein